MTEQQEIEKTFDEAIRVFGKDNQIEKIIEECSELIHALQKYKAAGNPEQGREWNDVHMELADVAIMMEQAKRIFDEDKINGCIFYKAIRLQKTLLIKNKSENGNH